MKFLKRIFTHPDFWPVVLVIFVGLLASKGLIGQGYFNMHDDLQIMRQLSMEKCFQDLQIPCRWIPDMGYGFGFPLFNFYPPLPYLVGQGIRLFGVSFIDTVKLVFILAFVTSGLTMYYLAKQFFGRFGGVVSALFYVWAPYHSVDIYVRGAMNEAWALIWFPAILFTSYKLITSKVNKYWIIGLALSWFGLLTSHNLMALIFGPIFAAWCLMWMVREKAYKKIPSLIISGILAIGLAAFFTLPVVAEQKYTHADSLIQGYYEYDAHFASINQILFSRFWGYGASVWMAEDDRMSFQVGHLHWILSLVIIAFAGLRYWKKRKVDNILLITLFLFIGGWFTSFMIHSRSTPIWVIFKPLSYVQFPWRFLALVIFCFSFLSGALVMFLSKKTGHIVLIILSLGLIGWNWNYFVPEHGKLGPLTDEQKLTGVAWDLQQTAGIYDYLPKTAEVAPNSPQKGLTEVMEGKAEITDQKQNTNSGSFKVNVTTPDALIRINIFRFPDWRVFIDGSETEIVKGPDDKIGRIHIKVTNGTHEVKVRLYDTPVRTIGNIISIISWLGLAYFMLQFRRGKRK